ncbi:serine hydrolase domain-containing protein [Actinomycetospora sp. CA-101289]|uniref:serine hydrolase domain-containing protein n=1 Tax=Actinomycetospora sp. CA-101289 TaxID=3239893 RepID=UPI003D97D797
MNPPTPPTNQHTTVDLDGLRATVLAVMERQRIPGLSLAVTSSDRLLHHEVFGLADLATARPVTTATRFLWFSMSKVVTATAALRLADEGRLDLDAPVTTAVPSYTARGRRGRGPEPRLRQLLDHTAGASNPLPLRWVRPAAAPDPADDEVHRLLRRARPTRRIGGQARYSNLGYLLLAEAIAQAAGEPFEQYVQHAVLDPVGMHTTGYRHDPTGDHATGYVLAPRPARAVLRAALPAGIVADRHGDHVALHPFTVTGAGYGGLIGNASDAARLLRLHLADGTIDGRTVLRPETTRAMRTITTPGKPFDLGLAWFRRPADRTTRPGFVEHWGSGGGFFNLIRLYPDADLGVVIMANTTRRYDHDTIARSVHRRFAP